MIGTADDPLSIDLYLRDGASSARPRQEALRTRLRRLESTPLVDELTEHVWPSRVCDDTPDLLERVEGWEAWAEASGCSLAPAFERRVVTSMVSETTHEEVVLPVVWVDVRAGDQRLIAPHVDDGPYTVPEFVTALETRDGLSGGASPARTVA
jgi:hypothetical protein